MREEYVWNPWHGCTKYSEGCRNCYMFRRDESVGKDPTDVHKTSTFYDGIKKKKDGSSKFPSGSVVFVCMTSDFFHEKADSWRNEIWQMIKLRSDVSFFIITKRITRFMECIPDDWGDGYDNVTVLCTVENQRACDERLPVFVSLPIKNKQIVAEPLLSPINLSPYLDYVKSVTVGGESGSEARPCNYDWILDIRKQCLEKDVCFWFKQTGARFIKDGKMYRVLRRYQHSQARKAGINIRYEDIK